MLAHAQRSGNVAETCRTFGISRTRYHEWKNRADLYGLDALVLKERRSPRSPRPPRPGDGGRRRDLPERRRLVSQLVGHASRSGEVRQLGVPDGEHRHLADADP
ncbi:MAG: helix-turn-helix domain-containing protein [Acidimicrobiales bacterium]